MLIVTVNGKDIDLDKARPITVRDWRELKKIGVNVMKSFQEADPDVITNMVIYLLQKANKEITEDDVLSLPGTHLIRILELVNDQQTDVPFLEALYVFAREFGWTKSDLEELTTTEVNFLMRQLERETVRKARG